MAAFQKAVVKYWMKAFSRIDHDLGPWEGYAEKRLALTPEEKTEALLKIACSRYEESKKYKTEQIFKTDFNSALENKDLLEIGSNHGGATYYFYERYKPRTITGIDTTEMQATISALFFKKMGATLNYYFQKAFAEDLPFSSDSFDAIISYDVFEHVADIQKTLFETFRVLRPGGRAFIAFPSYYHPTQHHLSTVTLSPCIHWFYSPEILMEVYFDILDEHPEYKRKVGECRRKLKPWEKLNIINGTTFKQFRGYLKQQPWKKTTHIPLPLGVNSHFLTKYPILKPLSYVFWFGTKLPILSEVCNHRIVYVLEK